MKSDKEYIEKIIKNYERRKKMAVLFGVVGVIFGVATFMVYVELGKITNDLISSISSFITEGQTIAENDIKYIKVNNELSYVVGLRAGQTINSLATASGFSLGYCLYLLFWSRKEKINKQPRSKLSRYARLRYAKRGITLPVQTLRRLDKKPTQQAAGN